MERFFEFIREFVGSSLIGIGIILTVFVIMVIVEFLVTGAVNFS